MKKLLLVWLLLGALCAHAQTPTTAASYPLKKADVILVRTSDSLGVAYTKLTRALLAAGYGLDKSDKDAGYVQTTARPTAERKTVTAVARIALLREPQCTVIQVRGDYFLASLTGAPITKRGMGGSPAAAAWAELERIAKLYPGGIIAYRVER